MFETSEATVADWNDFWYSEEESTTLTNVKGNMTIDGLLYEEVVLLQELLIRADDAGLVEIEDMRTFNSLYDKVMNS